jgi:ParB-like nuclease domain
MDAETPQGNTTLTRQKLVRLANKPEARISYEELAKQAKKTKPPPKTPKTLALSELHIAPLVFQWRHIGRSLVAHESDLHTLDLARALQDSSAPFEPLLVYLIGEKYYVLDGHHRLDAYRSVQWSEKVPVTVFSGTLDEARSKALELNSRNKLAMTREDKREAAWELTKTTNLSVTNVVRLSTVSRRTVNHMRAGWKKLCEQFSKERDEQANKEDGVLLDYESFEEMRAHLTWANALTALHGIKFPTREDWYDHEVEEMTKLLRTSVGFKLIRNPDITAVALRKLHPDLPRALIYKWAFAEWETIEELIEERELSKEMDF